MEALQLNPATKTLTLTQAEIPSKINSNEVLVKVAYSGVCGTDLHIIEGKFPCCNTQFTLGHEFSGIVWKVGADITHIKEGDRVAVDPNRGCNVCPCCTTGSYHLCTEIKSAIGVFQNGGWAEYCKAPGAQVYKIPDTMTLKQAALAEPMSCLVHGWEKIAPIEIGSQLLISGAGIIGNLWSGVLHHAGHRKVIVCEPIAARRVLNQKLQTGYECLSPSDIKKISTSDPTFGIDVCIDCSGNAMAIEESIKMLKAGGKMCIFGVAAPEARVSISPYEMYKKELTIIGVVINPFGVPRALKFIDAMGDRYLDYERLGIEVYSLKQYKEALALLAKGSISKVVFQVGTDLV